MTQIVEMPLWLLLLILAFAAVTFASHFLFPSVRWFLRVRAERVVAKLNKRLSRPIEPFKLARRYDTIQRLTYDPGVLEAVTERARETGVREDVVLEEARDYAREIAPAFSATMYFGLAIRIARWLSTALYRVRIVHLDPESQSLEEGATVIYVINHRSNMDYVLLTYLASESSALSFAMGEWGRTWPLRPVLRAIGGYFIRRKNGNTLYRRVLAQYVHLATSEGLTQAIFPEGRLSLDGAPQKPKFGLLSYVLQAKSERDIIFVPVSVNYDRVLEDRVLLDAAKAGKRRFKVRMGAVLGNTYKILRRRFDDKDYRFGHAAVVFGTPIRLRDIEFPPEGADPSPAEVVGETLMAAISKGVPVLPVPLIAEVLGEGEFDVPALIEKVKRRAEELGQSHVHFPETGIEAGVHEAIKGLSIRKVIRVPEDSSGPIEILEPEILGFYARSVAHLRTLPAAVET